MAPNLPTAPPCRRCERQRRARLEEDARLVARRWAGSASPARSRVRLTSWLQLPFLFFLLLIPIAKKLPPAREITCAALWLHIFLTSGYVVDLSVSPAETWTNGKRKDGMTISLQSKAISALECKMQANS